MKLKKLLPELVQAIVENGFDVNPKEIQSLGMPQIKSGADAFIIAPEDSGKTTLLVMSIIQQLKKAEGEIPRAMVMVQTKEDAFAVEELFRNLGKHTNLRYFLVFDQGILQYQKDMIYDGIDVLIGTPRRINELMSTTGFPLSGMKIMAFDDTEAFYTNRMQSVIYRLGNSCPKAQVLVSANEWIDSFDLLAEHMMKNINFIELEEESEDEEE